MSKGEKGGDKNNVIDMSDVDAILRRPSIYDENVVIDLAKVPKLKYAQRRKDEAKKLGISVVQLDQAVREQRKQSANENTALPHWEVEPWPGEVSGGELLDNIKDELKKYIWLPAGAADALALWVLHAWTFDAGDISPFLVLLSPTKRCGKTSVLIVLQYLTPKSELASNISASALFRYVEDMHPTLLIDEADSFVKDNEELRGILNSGHTKTAAYVIRNVETEGEHKPKRFSTWAPKAIATIRKLADTLEDRAIILQLQRKPKSAKVERLRKRDNEEFAILRRKAARWAEDNFAELTDPDPKIPDVLNDRAADNWRPLIAIADLAGDAWSRRAREAACLLSGEGHDAPSLNVQLLAHIREAFGNAEAIRTVDLIEKLAEDKERPWVEYKHGKKITDRQIASLLSDFGVISENVQVAGFNRSKGYLRGRFKEAWECYLPGQNTLHDQTAPSEAYIRTSPTATTTTDENLSVQDDLLYGSENDELSRSDGQMYGCTDKKPPDGERGCFATSGEGEDDPDGTGVSETAELDETTSTSTSIAPAADLNLARAEVETAKPEDLDIPACLRRCEQCGAPSDARGTVALRGARGKLGWLHAECADFQKRHPELCTAAAAPRKF